MQSNNMMIRWEREKRMEETNLPLAILLLNEEYSSICVQISSVLFFNFLGNHARRYAEMRLLVK